MCIKQLVTWAAQHSLINVNGTSHTVIMQGEVTEDLRLPNKEECSEAWHHIKPYAESLEKDSKALGRLQGGGLAPFSAHGALLCSSVHELFGNRDLPKASPLQPSTWVQGAGVLEAVQKHFRAPPAPVLEAWDPATLLDSMPFDKSDVYSSGNIGLVIQLVQQPAGLQTAVRLEIGHPILPVQDDGVCVWVQMCSLLYACSAASATVSSKSNACAGKERCACTYSLQPAQAAGHPQA